MVIASFRLPEPGALGRRPDGEGSWAIGVFYGSSPFHLRPIELVRSLELQGCVCLVWVLTFGEALGCSLLF